MDGHRFLRIMTWNVRHCMVSEERDETMISLDRIGSIVASVNADIVGLQEVDRFWPRSNMVDQPAELSAYLGTGYWFGPNLVLGPERDVSPEYGTATFSKLPVTRWQNTLLPNAKGMEQRGLLEVEFDLGQTKIVFMNTHLQYGHLRDQDAHTLRSAQTQMIADRIARTELPVILVGDFNAEPGSPELDILLNAGLRDAWAIAGDGGRGRTVEVDLVRPATRRIDYVFVSKHWEVISAKVLTNSATRRASDHYPVVAEIRLGDR